MPLPPAVIQNSAGGGANSGLRTPPLPGWCAAEMPARLPALLTLPESNCPPPPAVDAYYEGSSSSLSIPSVRVPLLVIQARTGSPADAC